MIALDTNVLIHADRAEMPLHAPALALVRRLANGVDPWGIPVFVVGEFLRLVTHRAVFKVPTPLDRALNNLDALIDSPSCSLLTPGSRYRALFRTVAVDGQAVGSRIHDAQIVAVCREHGAQKIVSLDRGMRRFGGVEIVDLNDAG